MVSDDPLAVARDLLDALRARGQRLVLAESCTGGLLTGCLTEVAGSSAVVERGFVTYSNRAKAEVLGVPQALLDAHGAVCAEVAEAMAAGALARADAHVSIAITGIAGPGGGSEAKPVGLVFIAAARTGAAPTVERHVFPGDRTAVRGASVAAALDLIGRVAAGD
jgi:nicotinamide-nucleotide amidase